MLTSKNSNILGLIIGLLSLFIMELFNILLISLINNRIYLWFLKGTYWYGIGIVIIIAILSVLLGISIARKYKFFIILICSIFLINIGFVTYHFVRIFSSL
jgi:hypothetical protein